MLTAVEGLIAELRRAGIPVRVSESIDVAAALPHLDLGQRAQVKAALRACLVKDSQHLGTFDTVFDLFFALSPTGRAAGAGATSQPGPAASGAAGASGSQGDGVQGHGGGGGGLASLADSALRELLIGALRRDDQDLIRLLAGLMVDRHAQIVLGRPVAGRFYLQNTMRAVDADGLIAALVAAEAARDAPVSALARRLQAERSQARVERFRQEAEAEIRRRLVADRGADAVARTLRTPLPEDVDFLSASQEEIRQMRATLAPMARKLASRMTRKRRHHRRGPLDFRRTVRRSMSYGGVPAAPVFRPPRPAKPDLVVLADISGSVATFAGFTLHLVSALRQEFSAVRSFVFVDGIDEVTAELAQSGNVAEAARRINSGGGGVWLTGRSDYGQALSIFWDRWGQHIRRRSTVLVLGDARTNYYAPREDVLAVMRQRAGHLYWLNPEPASAWDTGDSVIGRYAPCCDAVIECRNVRQLRAFVESLA